MPLPRRKAAQLGMPMFLIYDLRVIRAAPAYRPCLNEDLLSDEQSEYLIDRRLLHRATTILRSKAPSLPAKFNADSLVRHLDDVLSDPPYDESFDPQGGLVGERVVLVAQALDGLISLLCEEVAP